MTDGQVSNRDEIVEYAFINNQKARIHTFGIGEGCDKALVEQTAQKGRGSSNFASDKSANLSGQVVEALNKAYEPSLSNCTL